MMTSNDNRRLDADWLQAMPFDSLWPQISPNLKARIMARIDEEEDTPTLPAFMTGGSAIGRPALMRILTIAVVIGLTAGVATSRMMNSEGPGLPYASAVYGGAGLSLAGLFTGFNEQGESDL